ncbi:MAG: hypothetical protein R2709_10310 [Marmoricola sp.]
MARALLTRPMTALGSKSGSPYPNNDWTRISLYRNAQIPGSIFSKQLARPYTSNRTLFESGNMYWGASSGPGWSSLGNPQKVAPTTRIASRPGHQLACDHGQPGPARRG